MKVIYNKIVPFKGFIAMNFLGIILFVRKNMYVSPRTMNHELIHSAQYKETLFLGFLIVYLAEWLIRCIIEFCKGNFRNGGHQAYRKISFEQEAYQNDFDVNYLESRRHFCWIRYLFV